MEFIHHMLGGFLDLIELIVLMVLSPFLRIIDSKKLNTFVEKELLRIFEGDLV